LLSILVELDDLLRGFDHASDKHDIWETMSGFLSMRHVKAYIYHNLPALGSTDYNKSYSYQENFLSSHAQSCMLTNSGVERLLRENARTLMMPKFQNLDIHTMQWVCQSAHQNFCRLLTDDELDIPKLTAREIQILTWIALGKSNADIATILGISFHTVGTYTRRIFDKTKTNNRTSAALCGISNGLIDV